MRETRETRETREAAASGARHLGPESAGPVNALKPLGEVNAENAEREAAFINARKEQRQDGAKQRQDGAPRRLEDQLPKLPFVPGCKSDNAARCGLDAGVLKGSLADVARRMVAKTVHCKQPNPNPDPDPNPNPNQVLLRDLSTPGAIAAAAEEVVVELEVGWP